MSETFALTPENRTKADAYIARYPEGRQASAILAVLDLAQRQNGGWLSPEAVAHVADMLDMALIRVYEVISFYEMLHGEPVGEHMVRVCTTTPCMLRGSTEILEACKDELDVEVGGTTADNKFTLTEFECLGACVNAPIVWIDDDYYEDLDPDRIAEILKAFRAGERPAPGSQIGRQTSAPVGEWTALTQVAPPAAYVPPPEPEPEAAALPEPEAKTVPQDVESEVGEEITEGDAGAQEDDEKTRGDAGEEG